MRTLINLVETTPAWFVHRPLLLVALVVTEVAVAVLVGRWIWRSAR